MIESDVAEHSESGFRQPRPNFLDGTRPRTGRSKLLPLAHESKPWDGGEAPGRPGCLLFGQSLQAVAFCATMPMNTTKDASNTTP